jgi:WD40 repeat protein
MGERLLFHASGRGLLLAALTAVVGAAAALTPATSIDETEPNDSLEVAQLITLGDTVNGTIDPAEDRDLFAIDLEIGTVLDLHLVPSAGSQLTPYIVVVGFMGEYGSRGGDARVVVQVPSTGRYYLGVMDAVNAGGSEDGYRLSASIVPVDETEPNNTAATATLVPLGDTVVAGVSPGDVDFLAVDLTAGTYLGAEYAAVIDDAPLAVTIFDTDGSTPLAANGSGNRWPRYYATQAGRYYVATRFGFNATGVYTLDVRNIPTGPGDPPTMFAEALGRPVTVAAGLVGDLYAYDQAGARLLHVSPAGEVTTMASGVGSALAVDGFGDLLVAGIDSDGVPGIQRFAPDGTRSVFAADTTYANALAVAPDGDVWAMGSSGDLRRYSPNGIVKAVRRIETIAVRMAFSPNGELHFISGSGAVYRLATNGPLLVPLDPGAHFTALAFDEDGYLYVADGTDRTIRLYDPSYNLVEAPFATVNLDETMTNLLFLRDASGAMTSRLVVTKSVWDGREFVGTVLELNPAGVRAVGNPPQPHLLRMATTSLRDGVAGAAYADTVRLLDAPGEVRWELTEGDLPNGLLLDAVSGAIDGIPERGGAFTVSVRGTSDGRFGSGTFTIAISEPVLALADIMNTILGAADLLTEDQQRFLDLQGNRNGLVDVGDVRAYLTARGALPALAVSAVPRREEP